MPLRRLSGSHSQASPLLSSFTRRVERNLRHERRLIARSYVRASVSEIGDLGAYHARRKKSKRPRCLWYPPDIDGLPSVTKSSKPHRLQSLRHSCALSLELSPATLGRGLEANTTANAPEPLHPANRMRTTQHRSPIPLDPRNPA
jgi:hypothetical protein